MWKHGSGRREENRAFLLYDAECGPCTRFMKAVKRLDLGARIVPIPLQNPLSFELVKSRMTRHEMMRSFHLVSPSSSINEENQVFSAGDGLIHLIPYLPLGNLIFRPVKHARKLRKLIRWTYDQCTRLRWSSRTCATR